MSDADTIQEIAAASELQLRQTVFISHANPEDNEC